MRTTNIKFSGMASGLDTESMVQALTMPYKQKADAAKQDQLLLELKKDKWKEVNIKVQNFYTNYLSKMRLEGSFLEKKFSISNPNLVEIKGSFPEGNHNLEIVQLAEKAKIDTVPKPENKEKTLDELGITGTLTMKIGGKDVNLDVDALVASSPDATLEDLAKEMQNKIDNDPNLTSEEKAGTEFRYDKNSGGFLISSTSEIGFSPNNPLLDKLGIEAGSKKPTEAKVIYNGMTIKSSTNEIEVDGVKMNLKGTGTVNISSTLDTEGTFDFIKGFVEEYNKLIEELNEMVSAPYNKDYKPLLEEQKKDMSESDIKLWNEKVEKSVLRKDPVIEKLLSNMRDILGSVVGGNKFGSLSEIGISTGDWKEKGKLQIDEKKLKEAIEQEPQAVMDLFAGNENEEDAKIVMAKKNGWLDKDGNIKEDPLTPGVKYDLDKAWGTLSKDKQEAYMKETVGFGDRLYNALTEMFKGDKLKSSNFLFNDKALDTNIKSQKDKFSKLESKMYTMEDYYYKQFTAMEKMLSQLNSQSQALMGQLG